MSLHKVHAQQSVYSQDLLILSAISGYIKEFHHTHRFYHTYQEAFNLEKAVHDLAKILIKLFPILNATLILV